MAEQYESIIRLENLSKIYDGKKVLDHVGLDIKRGEFVTLLGPSGCGKTTTLRLIAGFIRADEGRILLEGKDIAGVPPHQRPFNTVFQRYALFPHLDVYDNIAFGLKLKKIPEAEIDKRVRRVLKMVAMTDYEDRDVESLSGGQQQRVAIARALVGEPKVLLLDEPLAALDRKMREDMQLEIKEMHQKLGITFIYVTHDQEEALTLSDTVVVMRDGKIQQIGSPRDIYNEPVNSFVADFIGDSNILNGTMIRDKRVAFIGHEFDCVDKGFGENVPVDVVIRPEDIYIKKDTAGEQFTGTVTSCIFKGIHYNMLVQTDGGYELEIQDYNAFEPGTVVGMHIHAGDIQVMKKDRVCNNFEGELLSPTSVRFLDAEWEIPETQIPVGTKISVQVAFNKVNLQDNPVDGTVEGEIYFMLYKGDRYHITVRTKNDEYIYVDTNDIWDKGDQLGVKIAPRNIKITPIKDYKDDD
jgi:spermidine/putrescine transport system ATP-binding protein